MKIKKTQTNLMLKTCHEKVDYFMTTSHNKFPQRKVHGKLTSKLL